MYKYNRKIILIKGIISELRGASVVARARHPGDRGIEICGL
jgi:hypothetical protein